MSASPGPGARLATIQHSQQLSGTAFDCGPAPTFDIATSDLSLLLKCLPGPSLHLRRRMRRRLRRKAARCSHNQVSVRHAQPEFQAQQAPAFCRGCTRSQRRLHISQQIPLVPEGRCAYSPCHLPRRPRPRTHDGRFARFSTREFRCDLCCPAGARILSPGFSLPMSVSL